MKKIVEAIRKFFRDESGSPSVEYVGIIIVVLGVIIALFAVGAASRNKVDEAANYIENFDFNNGLPGATDVP